jgi:DNA-binding CsgD family transcriptional regulator
MFHEMGVPGAAASVIGREEELVRIEQFLGGADEGAGILVLEGEAGIGKTTLWRAAVERARELGFRVLEARPAAPERELSFAALGDLLVDLHEEIGGLPAPQRRGLRIALALEEPRGNPAEERVIAVAVLELLRRLAAEGPLVVAIDDRQWLDPPSASALQFAFRRIDDEPVRVLATSRPGASDTVTLESAERLSIGPLPVAVLDQLVRGRLGASFLRPTLRRLEEASGGNPFYALEIAASVLRSGRPLEAGEPLPIPARLRELVRDRLATLTPAAREVALATAALAQPALTVIAAATERGPTAVAEAVAAGVLDRDGALLRFKHPLFASALYEDSAPAERKHVHRCLAELVEEPEERARHLAEATDGPAETVASALEAAAAGTVARGAPDVAARLAKRAADLTPSENRGDAHRRRLDWARYSFAAGDPSSAEALLERELELAAAGRERAETEFELGKARFATLGGSAALACYERALVEIEGTDEIEFRARLLIELEEMYLAELRTDSDASGQAVALAERLEKPDLLARALGTHAWKLVLRAQPPPADYWRRALAVEEEAGEMRSGGPADVYARLAFTQGEFEAAAELAGRVAKSMRRTSDPLLPNALIFLSEVMRVTGDWEAAARFAEEAHDTVLQTGRESFEPLCLVWRARVALPRGDLDLARRHAEDAIVLLERLAPSKLDRAFTEAVAQSVFAETAEMSGQHAEAHEWWTSVLELDQQLGRRISKHALAETIAADVECLIALGSLEEAMQRVHRLEELTDPLGIPTADGIVTRTRGLVAAAAGDPGTGLRHLEEAVASFEALPSPYPLEHGRTLLMLGALQRRARQKLTARQTLERALAIFERLGARLWAEKTRGELGLIGGRPTRSGALTATEQTVAGLVAAGRSNAEVAHELFMSPKTVEWNLSKIYKKLHVRSRAELAAKLAKQALIR